MPRRRKGAVRKGRGSMCNICGMNCGKGGALSKHVEGHGVDYATYKKCFYDAGHTIIADAWEGSLKTNGGRTVLIHVLVRRVLGDPGKRGVTRVARPPIS